MALFPDITCDDIFRLETAHLWLRWLRATDAAAVAAIGGRLVDADETTASIRRVYAPSEAERFILGARATTAAGHALILAVTLKAKSQTLIGILSAESAERDREVEIGYVVAPSAAGNGYAAEAAATLVDAIFNLTEARAITADCRLVNPASRRVLEKCGFVVLKTGPKMLPGLGGPHECDVFGLDRHAWSSRAAGPRLPAMAQQPRTGGPRA